jgi:hypothetical protein
MRPSFSSARQSSVLNYDTVEMFAFLPVLIVNDIQPAKPMRYTLPANLTRSRLSIVAVAFLQLFALPLKLPAQENRGGEIVANLATGRVVFCVTKDAIIVAAAGGGGEVGSRPPAVFPVSSGRIGVLLGAVDWTTPGTAKATRFDAELPVVAANALRRPSQKPSQEPSEIEDIGVGVLELIRPVVDQIHHKLDLAPDEPLVELLLADYVQDYGPEVWTLQYRVRQENLANDYWQTRILRPAYIQLYPPEKGEPRTFVETEYPANLPPLQLAARVARPDPQFDRVSHSSREVSDAIAFIAAGNSTKAASSPTVDFMRAAVPLAAGSEQNLTLAVLDMNRGFQWILAPQEPVPPGKIQTQPTEPDAPSLRKRGPRPQ